MAKITANNSITVAAGSTITFCEGGIGQAILDGNIYTLGMSDVFLGPFASAETIQVLVTSGPINYYTVAAPAAGANMTPVFVDPLTGYTTPASGAVFVPAGLTYGHVMDAITKLQATGKAGTIQFEPDLYDFSAAGAGLPWLDGVSYRGVHPHVRPGVGQGAIDDVAATFQGGTVLLGNGTFEGISANRTPRGAPDATRADATVTGACIRDIGMENFSTALAAGALNEYGIGLLEISNVYIINPDGCRSFDFQTSAHVYMRTVKSFGGHAGRFIGTVPGGGPNAFLPGNSVFDDLYHTTKGKYLSEGYYFGGIGNGGNCGISQIGRIQANQFSRSLQEHAVTTSAAGVVVTGSIALLAVGMPVVFAASIGGFTAKWTYFIVSIDTGTNTLQLAARPFGAVIVPTNATGTMYSRGHSMLTIGGPSETPLGGSGPTGGSSALKIKGVDLEGESVSPITLFNANGVNLEVSALPEQRDITSAVERVKTMTCYNSITVRSSRDLTVYGGENSYDVDGTSIGARQHGGNVAVNRGVVYSLGSRNVNGETDRQVLAISDTVKDATNWPGTLNSVNPSGRSVVRPGVSIGQLVNLLSTLNTNFGDASIFGHNSVKTTGNAVYGMPTIEAKTCGQPIYFANTTGFTVTINVNAGNEFNRKAGATQLVIPCYGFLGIRAEQVVSGEYFYAVESASFATGL